MWSPSLQKSAILNVLSIMAAICSCHVSHTRLLLLGVFIPDGNYLLLLKVFIPDGNLAQYTFVFTVFYFTHRMVVR